MALTQRFWLYVFNRFPVELDGQTVNWVISDSLPISYCWLKGCQKANMAPHETWMAWDQLNSGTLIKYSLSSHWQKLCQHHWFPVTLLERLGYDGGKFPMIPWQFFHHTTSAPCDAAWLPGPLVKSLQHDIFCDESSWVFFLSFFL